MEYSSFTLVHSGTIKRNDTQQRIFRRRRPTTSTERYRGGEIGKENKIKKLAGVEDEKPVGHTKICGSQEQYIDRILYRSGINNVWMRVCETNWDSLQCYNCVLPVHILVLCCAYISRNTFDSARICSTSHFPRDCLLGCNHSWNVCVQCTSFTRILLSMYLNSPMFRLSQPDSRKGRTKSIS